MAQSNAYLLLSDGSLHRTNEGQPSGLYVAGTLTDERFTPEGDVQGDGSLGTSGSPGWMELFDGSFHGDQTARPPFPPYVRGYRAPDGKFHPKTRKITY